MNPGEVMTLAVDKPHRTFNNRAAAEHRSHVVANVQVANTANDVHQRATPVTGNEIEDLRDGRRKVANLEIFVEKDRRNLGALEQIIEIAVGAVQFLDLAAELVVHGLQFFVHRLQFLFRGLELFIGRLQLLIDREQLFIG